MNRRNFLKGWGYTLLASGFVSFRSLLAQVPSFFGFNPDRGYKSFKWSRLSDSKTQLKDNDEQHFYKVVIIGSGYGASVAAARLSTEKAPSHGEMCLIERGDEWQPGDFPDKLDVFEDAKTAFRPRMKHAKIKKLSKYALNNIRTYFSFTKAQINPFGILDLTTGSDADIITVNALGGGSNLNGAVTLRPKPEVFTRYRWNKIDINYEAMEPYFKRVEQNLNTERYIEDDSNDLPPLNKSDALRDAHQQIASDREFLKAAFPETGETHTPEFIKVPLAINLTQFDGTKNNFGVTQFRCSLCGDCFSGCNVGAKNTLLTNYLKTAKDNGCEIYTKTEVDYIEKIAGGYRLHLKHYDFDHEGPVTLDPRKILKRFFPRISFVQTRSLYLGAGSLGTPRILFKSRKYGSLKLSKTLGLGFSANGDEVAFSYNASRKFKSGLTNEMTDNLNTAGYGTQHDFDPLDANSKRPVGPVITSMIDFRHMGDTLIQDGSLPSLFAPRAKKLMAMLFSKHTRSQEQVKHAEVDRDEESEIQDGAFNRTFMNLCMGYDSSKGELQPDSRNEDLLHIKYPSLGEEPAWIQSHKVTRYISNFFKSHHLENLRTSDSYQNFIKEDGGVPLSVHPLGGAMMAVDKNSGVCDKYGQVFSDASDDPKQTYPGLFAICGSILPGSTGANPLLTITANAERILDYHIRESVVDKAIRHHELEEWSIKHMTHS